MGPLCFVSIPQGLRISEEKSAAIFRLLTNIDEFELDNSFSLFFLSLLDNASLVFCMSAVAVYQFFSAF